MTLAMSSGTYGGRAYDISFMDKGELLYKF
jgi:hypothetical protein